MTKPGAKRARGMIRTRGRSYQVISRGLRHSCAIALRYLGHNKVFGH